MKIAWPTTTGRGCINYKDGHRTLGDKEMATVFISSIGQPVLEYSVEWPCSKAAQVVCTVYLYKQ